MSEPRVALYARVSTMDQNSETQLRELREHAERRGWTLQGEYVDHGVSGARSSRPQLDAMMADARRRKFDVVLVWRFDRFARSTTHLLSALDEFRKVGINFVSLHEAVDTSSALGQMVFTICAAVAELERNIIRERVIAGVRRAQAEGTKLGRPKAMVDMQRLTTMRQEGRSMGYIARHLGVSKATISRLVRVPAAS